MTDTGRDLYRALCASPEDDTLRLVYADWLQENGDEDRAELIRMQVKLVKCPPGPEEGRKASNLMARYRKGAPIPLKANTAVLMVRDQLIREKHPEWKSIPCPECGGNQHDYAAASRTAFCPTCSGTGNLALRRGEDSDSPIPTRRSHERRPGSWQKGYWVPHCTLAELATETDGKATPNPWARALARSVPVASLGLVDRGLVDRVPWKTIDESLWGWWDDAPQHSHSADRVSTLPRWAMNEIAGDPRRADHHIGVRFKPNPPVAGGCILFASQAAALDALFSAAARWLVREVWEKQEEKT